MAPRGEVADVAKARSDGKERRERAFVSATS